MAKPVVFISSTCEDLEKTKHRDAARDAALGADFYPEMKEYWEAKDNPPLKECLARVAKADVLVVIVAYRFGWVPDGQSEKDAKKRKSITWLECEKAKKSGKDILAFLADEDREWPAELREEHELSRAVQENRLTPELSEDIQWRVNRLKEFKAWLDNRAVRVTFTTPEDLRGKIESALLKWCRDKNICEEPPQRKPDPTQSKEDKIVFDIILGNNPAEIDNLLDHKLKFLQEEIAPRTKELVIDYIYDRWEMNRSWVATVKPMKWFDTYFDFFTQKQSKYFLTIFKELTSSTPSYKAMPYTISIVRKITPELLSPIEKEFVRLCAQESISCHRDEIRFVLLKLREFVEGDFVKDKANLSLANKVLLLERYKNEEKTKKRKEVYGEIYNVLHPDE